MKRGTRTVLVAAALASFIAFLWMETTLGRSPSRGWVFFVGYAALAWLLDRGEASSSLGGVLKVFGLDNLNAAELLRSLICWGGGVAWVYWSARLTNDTVLGAIVTFGPPLILLVIGTVFALRGFGITNSSDRRGPKS